jgi:hypothetical protein
MTPRIWISLAAAGAVLAAVLGLYWKGHIDAAARSAARVAAAESRAAVSRLETRGERDLAGRVEIVVRQKEAASAALTDLAVTATKAPDADEPLDPDRIARLRDFDRGLCEQADLAGCASADDAYRGGPPV